MAISAVGFSYVGHCLLERDGLVRYVTGEVTLQLLECDGLGHRRHFVGHSDLIGAWRFFITSMGVATQATDVTAGHAAFIGAQRPRSPHDVTYRSLCVYWSVAT